MDAQTHLMDIRAKLSTSSVVETITILEEQDSRYQGYFRARLTLVNKDFLELSAYFLIENDQPKIMRYRYQWMDESLQVLKKRWDNTKHFPNLPNFPHHIHLGNKNEVIPGKALNIIELIDLIEQEIRE